MKMNPHPVLFIIIVVKSVKKPGLMCPYCFHIELRIAQLNTRVCASVCLCVCVLLASATFHVFLTASNIIGYEQGTVMSKTFDQF